MKKYYIMLTLAALSLSSCKQTTKEKKNENTLQTTDCITNNESIDMEIKSLDSINSIKTVLKKQVERGAEHYWEYFTLYEEADLLAAITVSKELLRNNNYKPQNDFADKIHSIFHVRSTGKNKYISINKYTGKIKSSEDAGLLKISDILIDGDGDDYSLHIVFDGNFISDFLLLPMLFNYRKYYPDIASMGDIPQKYERTDKVTVDKVLWKDVEDLEKQQEMNIKRLVHRNKYLFNDSKSSLTWLLLNDHDFLTRLVNVFGYDREPRINQMVLGNVYKEENTSPLVKLFAAKDINTGKLQMREGLMQYIVDNTAVDDKKLLNMLYEYANLLLHSYKDSSYKMFNTFGFTKSEKLKIVAYAGYYIELAYRNNGIKEVEKRLRKKSFLLNELAGNKELLHEIDKNNYYGLPDFAAMIDDIMTEISETNTNTNTYVIEDPDGYVNVREGKGTSYSVTGTIPSGKQIKLLISPEESDWWRVKYQDIVGYVHKSRIKQL
ncbi:MAG: SH3 domain-containing protein [Prevotellaceae bacterium]|jgi:uncharacterized protein YgiM (DUF1202 family)|nr:SH3 domain-containing protein [Prevotellaceae bacterium]